MPTTDNSISTRIRFIKGRALAKFALSDPIKPQLDQSNETYEIIQQGEKPYIIQPPIGGVIETLCECPNQQPPIQRPIRGPDPAPEPEPEAEPDQFAFESINRGAVTGYNGSVFSTPIIGPNGNVYYGNAASTFRCINGLSGTILWSFVTSTAVCDPTSTTTTEEDCDNLEGNSILYNNVVYFGSTTQKKLYAVNATNGLLIWSYLPSPTLDIYSRPVLSPDKTVVYCSNNAGAMFAVYTATGLPVPGWPVLNVAGNGTIVNNTSARVDHIVANDGTIYSHTYNSSALFFTGLVALNPNGTIKWQNSDAVGSFVLNNATTILYAVATATATIIAYNASTGAQLWAYTQPSTPFTPNGSPRLNSTETVLYYTTNERRSLVAIDLNTRTLLWSFDVGGLSQVTPAVASNGDIYVTGLYNNTVWAVHSDGTLKWKFVAGGPMYSSPLLSNNQSIVYAGSYDTGLYALSTETGLPV